MGADVKSSTLYGGNYGKYKGRVPWFTESLKQDIQIENKVYVRSRKIQHR